MDKRLLDALNNLSVALEEISDALKDKKGAKSDTTAALQSGNFSKTIQEIHVGIKSIKKDTQEILKQQKTILELSKKKTADKKTDTFESDPKKDSSIKKGVTTILLIAVGVLAIGMAFKLVGKVDFLSVVGLGIGIYTVASAFEKIGNLKNLSYQKVLMISSVMPLMGMGIWLASKFLSRVSPMSIGQIITSIGIAGAFYFIAPVITTMMDAMMNPTEVTMPGGKKIKTSKFDMGRLKATMVALPILMIAMSLGITMSSWILSGIRPIGLGQIITAIAIAGMFSIAAMGIKGLIHALTEENEVRGKNGFKTKSMDMGKLTKVALFLPIVMVAIALGITLSSYILSLVKPIGIGQAITAILIAGMFAVVSWGISSMLTALSKINEGNLVKSVIMLPLLLPAIAMAITASSWVLSKVTPITPYQFLTSLAISILFIAFSVTLLVLSKADIFGKIKMRDVIMIPLIFVALATAIMLSSHILSVAAEISFGRSMEILAFSVVLCVAVVVVALTSKVLTKIGSVTDYIKGGISMAIVAASIMAVSHIISLGKYKNFPSWRWSLGVGLSLAAFGVGAVLLGTQVLNPFFYGGLGVMLLVSATVVAASHIISLGKYKKYPSVSWATGVGLSLAAFGVGAVLLGFNVLNPFFYAGLKIIKKVAQSIVDVSHILATGVYKNSINEKWAKGISIALGAFSPIYDMLAESNSLFGSGPSPEEFTNAIVTVSMGIVTAASFFNIYKGAFDGGPSESWSRGVGLALGAFAPVFKVMEDFPFSAGKKIAKAMIHVASAIVNVAGIFKDNSDLFSEGGYPSTEWGRGVGSSLKAFAPVFEYMSGASWYESGFVNVIEMVYGITTVASAIVDVAKLFSQPIKWDVYPDKDWSSNISKSIKGFMNISNSVADLNWIGMNSISSVVSKMVNTAKILSKNSKYFKSNIDPNFMKNISSNVLYYANLSNILSKQQSVGGFVKKMFMGDPISNAANGMVKLAISYDRLAKSMKNFSGALKGMDSKKLNEFRGMTSNIAILSALDSNMFDNMLTVLETRSSVWAEILNNQVPTTTAKRGGVKIGDKKGDKKDIHKKGKHGDSHNQMDILIDIMGLIVNQIGSGSTLDEFLQKKLSEKKGTKD